MAAIPLVRKGTQPLWAQLLADLRSRLDSHEFDESFPGELALVAEYGVSRHTVREALRRLRDEGLVVAGRGRAPRLAAPLEIEQQLGSIYSLFSAVESTGREQRSVVRTLDVRADGVVAARLGLEESTPLVHLERLRLAEGEPLAVDRVWLPAEIATPLLEVDFTHTGVYDELERLCGVRVAGGRENIRAVVPTDEERRLLGVDGQVAALAIERLGSSAGRAVEWRHTLVRGDRFTLTAHFSARDGYLVGAGAV